jgi:hypothetical protein
LYQECCLCVNVRGDVRSPAVSARAAQDGEIRLGLAKGVMRPTIEAKAKSFQGFNLSDAQQGQRGPPPLPRTCPAVYKLRGDSGLAWSISLQFQVSVHVL